MTEHTASCTSPFTWMLYFLAGGATGAGIALLLAPQSGRATRESMQRRFSETAGSARALKDQLVQRGQKMGDEARQRVDGAVSALKGDGGVKLSG